jgi:hypothetical protein
LARHNGSRGATERGWRVRHGANESRIAGYFHVFKSDTGGQRNDEFVLEGSGDFAQNRHYYSGFYPDNDRLAPLRDFSVFCRDDYSSFLPQGGAGLLVRLARDDLTRLTKICPQQPANHGAHQLASADETKAICRGSSL